MLHPKETLKLFSLLLNQKTAYKELVEFLFQNKIPKSDDFLKELDPSSIVTEATFLNSGKTIISQPVKRPQRTSRVRGSGDECGMLRRILGDYCNISFIKTYKYRKRPAGIPKFSVVVPTFNGSHRINHTLASLLLQVDILPEEYEILVIDDGSVDDTRSVVETFNSSKVSTGYIRLQKNYGPSTARNVGILAARGDFICFTDDDCEVPPNWISSFQQAFEENPEIAGVGGWYQTNENIDESIFDRYMYWYSLPTATTNVKSATMGYNACGNSANVCYRREVLLAVGGFNPVFRYPAVEDWELKVRLHKNLFSLLAKPPPVRHRKRLTFSSYARAVILRGWGRFLLYKIHGIMPFYYNITLINLTVLTIQHWRKLLTNLDGTLKLPLREKISFIFLAALTNFFFWIGKYLIPFELLEQRQKEMAEDEGLTM